MDTQLFIYKKQNQTQNTKLSKKNIGLSLHDSVDYVD